MSEKYLQGVEKDVDFLVFALQFFSDLFFLHFTPSSNSIESRPDMTWFIIHIMLWQLQWKMMRASEVESNKGTVYTVDSSEPLGTQSLDRYSF